MGTNVTPTHKEVRTGDIRHSKADIRKAERMLGYAPRVKFEEGLAETLAWYRSK